MGEELSDEHNDYDHDQERRDDAAELRAERRPRRLLSVGIFRKATADPVPYAADAPARGSTLREDRIERRTMIRPWVNLCTKTHQSSQNQQQNSHGIMPWMKRPMHQ